MTCGSYALRPLAIAKRYTHYRKMNIRPLQLHELERLSEINRTERIRVGYRQEGEKLIRMDVNWDAPNWFPEGEEHSIPSLLRSLGDLADEAPDTVFLGAFEAGGLIGIAAWRPRLTDTMSQLAFLHVDCHHRRKGVASALCNEIDRRAIEDGLPEMYVSATESESAVGFYRSRGFRPTATPHPGLLAIEPMDIHMIRRM